MINSLLVAASLKSIEEILDDRGIPYKLEENSAYKGYKELWERSEEKDFVLRQARPAIKRIFSKEPYVFKSDGDPLYIRFNDAKRRLKKDSFGEILLERADKDWRISLSVKSDAKVLATMPVADRDMDVFMNRVMNAFNEIDDFGDRIFGIPCSQQYFLDMNAILSRFEPYDKQRWSELRRDDPFVYSTLITPMLKAIGDEIPRICKDHPEAPQRLIDYFYGKIDYYYINPIDEVQVTRIGAVNSRRGLGRIPNNTNLFTPQVKFPTQLLDVRFANGRYGELSQDTIQFSFDGGWSVCLTIVPGSDEADERSFALNVYLPVTPFGSYRDQVDWEPEA